MSAAWSWEQGRHDRPHPGVESWRLDLGASSFIRYRFAAHAVYPLHAHAEEQCVIVLGGTLTLACGEAALDLAAGEVAYTPPHQPHGVTAGPDGAEFVNVVHPRRQG